MTISKGVELYTSPSARNWSQPTAHPSLFFNTSCGSDPACCEAFQPEKNKFEVQCFMDF